MSTTAFTIDPAQHTAAKIVAILYPIQMATGVFGEVVARGQLIVPGDPTKTAENIIAGERLFRLSIAGDLVTYILVMVLTWALYVLLRPVNRNLALLGAFFRLSELAVLCVATVSSLVVLQLLSGARYLQPLAPEHLHSFVAVAIDAQGSGMRVGFILLGLGSAIYAYLLLKSAYVPKALALLGIFGALLLALGTLAIIVFPTLGRVGMSYMMPMGLYEVGLGFWLLFKGIRAPQPGDRFTPDQFAQQPT
jgi:hypothetical protein